MDYVTLIKERLCYCFSGYFYKYSKTKYSSVLNDLSMTLKCGGKGLDTLTNSYWLMNL